MFNVFTEEGRKLTSLGWSKVFSWSWRSGTASPGLLNAQGSTLEDLALQALLSAIGLLKSGHLDESESTGLLGVRVQHDLALLNLTILGEETGYVIFSKTRMDSSHEEVGTSVGGTINW